MQYVRNQIKNRGQYSPAWLNVVRLAYHRYGLKYVALLLVLIVYSFIGAGVFLFFEKPAEIERHQLREQKLAEMKRSLLRQLLDELFNATENVLVIDAAQADAIAKTFDDGLQLYDKKLIEFNEKYHPGPHLTWDLWTSLIYSYTVISTIGYGHLYPLTIGGRISTMVYALFGIPLMLTALSYVGKLLTKAMKYPFFLLKRISRRLFRYCTHLTKEEIEEADERDKATLDVFDLPIPVAIGLVIGWIFVCSAITLIWETEWNYLVAFYFFFVSLSTIGFGDVVPSKPYFLMIMFGNTMIGMALVSMVINLIQAKFEPDEVEENEETLDPWKDNKRAFVSAFGPKDSVFDEENASLANGGDQQSESRRSSGIGGEEGRATSEQQPQQQQQQQQPQQQQNNLTQYQRNNHHHQQNRDHRRQSRQQRRRKRSSSSPRVKSVVSGAVSTLMSPMLAGLLRARLAVRKDESVSQSSSTNIEQESESSSENNRPKKLKKCVSFQETVTDECNKLPDVQSPTVGSKMRLATVIIDPSDQSSVRLRRSDGGDDFGLSAELPAPIEPEKSIRVDCRRRSDASSHRSIDSPKSTLIGPFGTDTDDDVASTTLPTENFGSMDDDDCTPDANCAICVNQPHLPHRHHHDRDRELISFGRDTDRVRLSRPPRKSASDSYCVNFPRFQTDTTTSTYAASSVSFGDRDRDLELGRYHQPSLYFRRKEPFSDDDTTIDTTLLYSSEIVYPNRNCANNYRSIFNDSSLSSRDGSSQTIISFANCDLDTRICIGADRGTASRLLTQNASIGEINQLVELNISADILRQELAAMAAQRIVCDQRYRMLSLREITDQINHEMNLPAWNWVA